MLNIYVTRQSVYWVTGSFNYVYPLFMLFLYWYILLKNSKENYNGKKLLLTAILSFFASATVEQGGTMAFGITVLFFIYNFFVNKIKNNNFNFKRYLVILISSFIGIISVIFSPAQFIRFGLEKKETFTLIDSIKNGITFLINVFKNYYSPHLLLLLLIIVLSFITIKKERKFQDIQVFNLISTFILGIGSQLMMLVSPVYGERNTLFGGVMIVFLTAVLLSNLPNAKNKFFKTLEYCFYSILIVISTLNSFYTYNNYKLTNEIQNKNIEIVNEYKKSNSSDALYLYKLKDERFGWSMPSISSYHEYWFKVYYEIKDTKIVWKEYEN